MNSLLARVVTLVGQRRPSSVRALDGFVDSLLQTFENCRPGLSDGPEGAGAESAESFFTGLYEKEIPRLRDVIDREELLLEAPAKEDLFRTVDNLIRKVVLPAYVRLSARFTTRERNDFYLAPEPFHGLERFGWALAGVVVGALVVLAPFIPLWSKEWIIPFMLGGLVFPDVRRLLMIRQYESEMNRLVAKTDHEIARIDFHYLMTAEPARRAVLEADPPAASAQTRAPKALKETS
jgi:hypothetical protein